MGIGGARGARGAGVHHHHVGALAANGLGGLLHGGRRPCLEARLGPDGPGQRFGHRPLAIHDQDGHARRSPT